MKNLLLRIPVNLKKYDSLIKRLDALNQEAIERLHVFIVDLYSTDYAELFRVWTLPHINDDMWHRYQLLHIRGLPEQILLEDAISAFKNKVRVFSLTTGDRHAKREKVAAKRAERSSDNS